MLSKKEELCEYVDSCMSNGLPMNRFTYIWFRFTRGLVLRDLVMCVKRNIIRG